jgi:RNA polymerase sigma factor (sigma-70 family)
MSGREQHRDQQDDPIRSDRSSARYWGGEPGRLEEMRAELLQLYDAHYHRVVAFLRAYGATLLDAQDAAQEAFLEAWRAVTTPGGWEQVEHPAAWIRMIALRRYRRPSDRRRQPPTTIISDDLLELPQPGPDPADLTAQTLDVLAALRSLDSEVRAVMAFYLDGFSAVETGAALEIDDQRVRNLRKKGRAQLAQILAQTRQQEGGTAR